MSDNSGPAFQFYAQDFLVGVMHFDMEERGIYITLLCYQWAHNRIPKERLGLILGLPSESQAVRNVLAKFETDGDSVYNKRLEEVREKRVAFIEKQMANGSKGGRPPKKKIPKKPTKSQKKPLEDRRLKIEDRIKKTEKVKREETIFALVDWLVYKEDEHQFTYESDQSLKAAITGLITMSGSDGSKAVEIINQSIQNGWKGFFPVKDVINHNQIPESPDMTWYNDTRRTIKEQTKADTLWAKKNKRVPTGGGYAWVPK